LAASLPEEEGDCAMFESIDEQIKHDEEATTSKKQRLLRLAATAVIALAVFAGLVFSVKMLNG
jgi:hypothetical protein